MSEAGRRLFGLSAIFLEAIGLYNRDFANIWQPVPEGMPGRAAAALITAALLVIAGAALQRRSTINIGAAILSILYFVFAGLWLRRIIAHPEIFATWGGMAEELAPCASATALWV